MTVEEYNQRLKQIDEDYKKSKNALYISYAKENALFGVGDIIKQNGNILKVEFITAHVSFGSTPITVYKGKLLNKDLSVKKRDPNGAVYQESNNNIELVKKA